MKTTWAFIIGFLTTTASFAQTTYTWNVTSGSYITAGNWTPARTVPANNDILVFDGAITPQAKVTNIPKQTIGKLRCINNVNVRLVGATRVTGAGLISRTGTAVAGSGTTFLTDLKDGDLILNTGNTTLYGEVSNITTDSNLVTTGNGTLANVGYLMTASLTIGDGTSTALDILSGSTLTLGDSGADPLGLRVASGSKGNIEGTVRMLYTRQRLFGIDSASIIIKSGAVIRTDSTYNGNPFLLTGLQNTVIFEPGSTFEFIVGSNPFAQSIPASKCVFMPGSKYVHLSTSIPSVSGRKYANFIGNFNGTVTATQNGTAVFDSIIITQGTFNINSSSSTTINHIQLQGGTLGINSTAGNINITGNIQVNSGTNLLFNGKFTSVPANVNFRGTTQQTISGTGNIRISGTADSTVRFRIQNLSGLMLQRNLDLNAAILDLDSGLLLLNGNTLTMGSSTAGFHGRATQLNGAVSGSGSLSRWVTTNFTAFGDSSLFPIGSATATYPIWVAGAASTAGFITVSSFTENAGVTVFGTPFSDVAPHGSINVNQRFNHAWSLTTSGVAGTNFSVRLGCPVTSGWIVDTLAMRVTLNTASAPGSSADGAGLLTKPLATKNGVTAAQLTNTFYVGTSTSMNPLPVIFVSISGKQESKFNTIRWTTTTEINLLHFEVEKKINQEYQTIGKVMATNGKSITDYLFTDYEGGSAYYRIKAVDYNGATTWSDALAISDKTEFDFVLTPNPVVDVIQITTHQALPVKGFEVYDGMGKLMPVQIQGNQVKVQQLTPGIYYLHVINADGVNVVKFVKQ